MDYNLTCDYCNHKWTEFFLNQRSLQHVKCENCKDDNITIRESRSEKVDYYVGCPSFPTKEAKTEEVEQLEVPPKEFLQDAVLERFMQIKFGDVWNYASSG